MEPSDWLTRDPYHSIRTSRARYTDLSHFAPKQTEEWRQISNWKKLSKNWKKTSLSILKIEKYAELTSMDLGSIPKCTFFRPKCGKKLFLFDIVSIEKIISDSAKCLVSKARHMFSYTSKYTLKYKFQAFSTLKYKYWNKELILIHNKI
jgi:hypothetical protein